MILLATTFRHRRYLSDVLNTIGLPTGSRLRWRYAKRYISTGKTSTFAIKRKLVLLVVIIKTDNGNHRVVPLRLAKLNSTKREGNIVEYELELTGYPNFNTAEQIHNYLIERSPILKGAVSELDAGEEKVTGPLTGETKITFKASKNIIDGWEKVVQAVDDCASDHKGPRFYYNLRFRRTTLHWLQPKHHELEIESAQKLRLHLNQMVSRTTTAPLEKPIGEIKFDVHGAPLDFLTTSRMRIDCRRDTSIICTKAGSGYVRRSGHLSIKINEFYYSNEESRGAAEDRTINAIARADIPITTGIWWPKFASIALGAMIAMTIISPEDLGFDMNVWWFCSIWAIAALGISRGLR